jgi:hypothetical protein
MAKKRKADDRPPMEGAGIHHPMEGAGIHYPMPDGSFGPPGVHPSEFKKGKTAKRKEPVGEPVKRLTDKEISNYLQSYLDRPAFKRGAPGPQFSGEEMLRGIKKFAGGDEEKRRFVEGYLDELLTQAQIEGAMHGRGRSARNNPFNVGEFDQGTRMTFEGPEQGVAAHLRLMYEDYLPRVDYNYDRLLEPGNFVNAAGSRYASNPEYENKVRSQLEYIRSKWAPPTGQWDWGE